MKIFIPLIFLFISIEAFTQPQPAIEWNRAYGGTLQDVGYGISADIDGGYLVAGCDGSIDGDLLEVLHGGYCDYWVLKLFSNGSIQYKRLLDGTGADVAKNIYQTPDGGYIVGGGSNSPDLAFSGGGTHGDFDFGIFKLSADSLKKVWVKCYGGSGYEDFGALSITSDQGYIMCGGTSSTNGDVTGNHGSSDYWVVKTDASGNIQWQKCYGGTGYDKASSVKQTADGGFIIIGFTQSNDGDVHGNHFDPVAGAYDYDGFIVKTNSNGDTLWTRCFGGTLQDAFTKVIQLSDGTYMMAGYATSYDGDVSTPFTDSLENGWLVKLDANGNLLWSKTFGGTNDDDFSSLVQDAAGGIVISGYSQSNDGTVSINQGGWDAWLMRVDADGEIIWDTTYGGKKSDIFYDLTNTLDNGIAAVGYSYSDDGDVNNHWGNSYYADYWVLKTTDIVGIAEVKNSTLNIFPSPAHDFIEAAGFGKEMNGEKIDILSLDGRKLLEQKISSQKNTIINISSLPPGFYLAQVNGSGE
ncbi:MAG: T9SS type A sorting domain-containing protein, partial [Chitinophagales bacterium]|nr:T9SS type A sorting domain-containing protein [Chitinophagales bacterium]